MELSEHVMLVQQLTPDNVEFSSHRTHAPANSSRNAVLNAMEISFIAVRWSVGDLTKCDLKHFN
jgi:hypothetical protein